MIDNSLSLSNKVFIESSDVVKAAGDFCVWFAHQEEAQQQGGLLVQKAGLSRETFDIMMWQLSVGFCAVNFNWDVQHIAQEEVAQVACRQSIAEELNQAFKSQLWDDVAYLLTFGIYS